MNMFMFWGPIAVGVTAGKNLVFKTLNANSIYAIPRALPFDVKTSDGKGIFTPFTGGRTIVLNLAEAFQPIYFYEIGRDVIIKINNISVEMKDIQTFLNITIFLEWNQYQTQGVMELGTSQEERLEDIQAAVGSSSKEIIEEILLNETLDSFNNNRVELFNKIRVKIDNEIDSQFPVDLKQIRMDHNPPEAYSSVLNESSASKAELRTLKVFWKETVEGKAGKEPTLKELDEIKKLIYTNNFTGVRNIYEVNLTGMDDINPDIVKAAIAAYTVKGNGKGGGK